ncbi:MAG: cyclic nucleotide-binding domain-containing protein [Mariprofundaceae bacterium]|nr:cyclic nucleotide-binding domain-containing protein [Mariprofundaceae bacterium]
MDTHTEEPLQDIDAKIYPILAVLFPDELHFFRSFAIPVEMAANVAVITEGQYIQYLYLIKSGVLQVNKRHNDSIFEIGSITPGEVFGEASILYNAPAGADVRTVEPCELYQIPIEQVRDTLNTSERFMRSITQLAERRSAAGALAVNPIFSTLPQAVREVILYNAQFLSLKAGKVLFHEGDADTRFMYLILGGEAEISMQHPQNPNKKIIFARLTSGDEIGEISVITQKPHAATVTATTPLRLIMISNESVQAWRERYSDFGHALYACVQHKLNHSLNSLRDINNDSKGAIIDK